ncbi:MAG TPA: hypothetical protein VFL76_11400 [Edaphocola sp.]|nr:hypothetical protein [Edaphocola sp.]
MTSQLFGQDLHSRLSRTITDSANQAFTGAVASITPANKTEIPVVTVTITNKDGYFHFTVPKETYSLAVAYFGKNIYQTEINLARDTSFRHYQDLIGIPGTIFTRERYKYSDSSYALLTFRYNFSHGESQ